MPITRTSMTDDDGSGTTGTILNNAWKQELYNQIDLFVAPWIDVPFNAGAFTASSGSWTVTSQVVYAYAVSNKTLYFAVHVTSTTITGSPVYLTVVIPGGVQSARQFGQPFSLYQGGAAAVGWASANVDGVRLYRDIVGTPYSAGTCHLTGVFTISLV